MNILGDLQRKKKDPPAEAAPPPEASGEELFGDLALSDEGEDGAGEGATFYASAVRAYLEGVHLLVGFAESSGMVGVGGHAL